MTPTRSVAERRPTTRAESPRRRSGGDGLASNTPAEGGRRERRLNEEGCWQAVVERRASAHGLFVVAVKTTGIYCRPGCPSRMPKRENVSFFRTPDEAESFGFRACKRCKPREPVRSDVTLVQRICRIIDASEGAPTLEVLSREAGVSPFHLQRTFKKVTGLSPKRYAERRRAERLKSDLRNGDGIASATYGAGLSSSSRLYERAPGLLGMTPGQYQRGGAGMRIAYTITTCMFGRLLVGATDRGVSAVSFGARDNALVEGLHREYPGAEIARDDGAIKPWVERVLRAVDAGEEQPDLPLDIRGTAFRARVWDALCAIPRGETRTYGEIAAAIGDPRAARAVGNACNANPVAIIIPCHRVVAGGGKLGGYGGGIENKVKLLEREKAG